MLIKVRIPSAETYRICTRPAVLKSLKQALRYFHLDKQPTTIYFNGEAETVKLWGGEFDGKRGSDHNTDVGYDDKIFVELETEDSEYNDGLDSAKFDSQHVPLMWEDKVTGASIRPVYNGRRLVITVNKYFKDRVQAQRFRDGIRDKLSQGHFNTLFDVQTHYPVTYDILGCYKEIYDRLLNAKMVDPAVDGDFIDWFSNPNRSLVPNDIISNLIGNNRVFAFKQELAENGLDFRYVNVAVVNKGAYIGKYEVSWSYSFYWNDHTHWDLTYPIQIFQQQMPTEFLPDIYEENKMPYATRLFMESKLASLVFQYRQDTPLMYHVLPSQDNWRPPNISWISPQLQVLLTMEDVPGEQVLLNIKDIQGFQWNPELLAWIMKYRTKVTRRHANPLQFKLFSNNVEVKESQLELRDNGDLVLLRPATLANIYRLTFNLDYAIRLYDEECRDDLVKDPDWSDWILDILFPGYEGDKSPDDTWDWWDIHNGIDVGDGEEVDFFERGMCGALIIAYNKDTPQAQQSWY